MYVNNLVGDIKANGRDFYRYINGQKKDTQGIPPRKRRNGNGVTESQLEQADEFNGQFTDVFNITEHSQVPLPKQSAPFMNDIVVSAVGVTKLLKGLNPSKALIPDELLSQYFNTDRSKAVLLLWFLTVTCSCCPYLYLVQLLC